METYLKWNNPLNDLIKEGVDGIGEARVGCSQFHVWIP